jgi:hypothetical protein
VWTRESITDAAALPAALGAAVAAVDTGRPALLDVITAGRP